MSESISDLGYVIALDHGVIDDVVILGVPAIWRITQPSCFDDVDRRGVIYVSHLSFDTVTRSFEHGLPILCCTYACTRSGDRFVALCWLVCRFERPGGRFLVLVSRVMW